MTAPYRNDDDALDTRLGVLLDELDVARARGKELRAIGVREDEIEKEIEDVRRRLQRRASKRRLSLLDDVRIASPCPADWGGMSGDERTRHCAQCDKDVYNLSAMSRPDAEAFLRGVGGDACIRVYRRADGTVITSDCPVGVTRKRRRRAAASLVGGGLLAAGAAGAFFGTRAPVAPPIVEQLAQPVEATQATSVATGMPAEDLPRMAMGAAPVVTRASRLVQEQERLNGQLAARAHTADVGARKRLETEIRATQQELAALRRGPVDVGY